MRSRLDEYGEGKEIKEAVDKALNELDEVGKEYIKKVMELEIPKGMILVALTRMLANFIESQFKPCLRKETLEVVIAKFKEEFN